MKIVMVAFAIVATVSLAGAASFTKDGTVGGGSYGYNYVHNSRDLVPDGSFENGCGVDWTCTADNTCVWIADLVPLGLYNYDGNMVAWLGGFCGGLATCYSEICQIMDLPWAIQFFWMAYVNDSVSNFYVSVDGNVVYSFVAQPSDHLQDYQQVWVDLGYGGTRELCFGVDNWANCGSNMGDNWFVDYVEGFGDIPDWPDDPTGVSEMLSISTVKALY